MSNIKTWLQGDLHTLNFGLLNNNLGDITLDVNDFDESWLGPFFYELIRLSTSIHLQRDVVTKFTLSLSEAQSTVTLFLTTYQSTLTACNGNAQETTYVMSGSNLGSKGGFTRTMYENVQNTNSYLISSSHRCVHLMTCTI